MCLLSSSSGSLLLALAIVALHGDHPDLPPCEHECTHRYETCVREIAVSGKSLLGCINAYYDCANRCDEDE